MSVLVRTLARFDHIVMERAPRISKAMAAPPHAKAFRWFFILVAFGLGFWALSLFWPWLELIGVLLVILGAMCLGFARAYTKGWDDRFARVEHINTVIAVSSRWAQRRVGHTCPMCGVYISQVVEQADERHPVHDVFGERDQVVTAMTYIAAACGHTLGFVKVG
jgi:hypothetical protein